MKKNILILCGLAMLVGIVFFYDQVLAAFQGMTVLESLKFIATFIIHVTEGTILAYLLYTLPEIAMPIIKFLKSFFRGLRMQRRAARRASTTLRSAQHESKPKSQRLTTDMLLRAYMLQQITPKARRNEPAASQPQDDIRIEF